MEDLQERPGPAIDWLRQSSPWADAAIARYALAAEIVRPGDRVLDCACGLGAGTAVLAAMSRGAAFLGVDPDPDNVAYAELNYGGPTIRFAATDPQSLEDVEDGSIDLVVAQDVLEYAEDWETVLAAFQRVLKPDGRVICTVPDRWADGAGRLTGPGHRRLFDSDTLIQALAGRFLVETKHIQLAPGGVRLPSAPRILRRWPLDKPQDAEWLIVAASANPYSATEAQMAAYTHPKFSAPDARPPVVADFGRFYDNPYLYRPLVQMGERLRDDGLLLNLALVTAEHARADSPDRGGAIAVLGYMVLERRNLDDADKVVALIEAYAGAGETDNPHTARWRLSHAFLAGKLMELRNDKAAAMAWYRKAAELDWRTFSPLLATKTVAAWFHLGRLYLLAGDEAAAREAFEAGVREALEAARAPVRDIVGDPEHHRSDPLPPRPAVPLGHDVGG
jgi:SAM-dependent methyltransferase